MFFLFSDQIFKKKNDENIYLMEQLESKLREYSMNLDIQFKNYVYLAFYDVYIKKIFTEGYVSLNNNISIFSRNQLGAHLKNKIDDISKNLLSTDKRMSSQKKLTNIIYQLLQNKEVSSEEEKGLTYTLMFYPSSISYEEKMSLIYVGFRDYKDFTGQGDSLKAKTEFLHTLFKEYIKIFVIIFEFYNSRIEEQLVESSNQYVSSEYKDYEYNEKTMILNHNRIEIKTINSLSKFIDILRKIGNHQGKTHKFYRGHSSTNYLLNPSIARSEQFLENEDKICEEIMRIKPEEFASSSMHLDQLKKMQHYGIPTRLLDISENPLIALYFAVEDNFWEDGELIIFETKEIKYTRSDSVAVLSSLAFIPSKDKKSLLKLSVAYANQIKNSGNKEAVIKDFNKKPAVEKLVHEIIEEKSFLPIIFPETLQKNYFVKTKLDNDRINRQSGAFIITNLNRYSPRSLNDYRFKNKDQKIEVYIIPQKAKKNIKEELDVIGINHAYVYPEIAEVSSYLKAKYA